MEVGCSKGPIHASAFFGTIELYWYWVSLSNGPSLASGFGCMKGRDESAQLVGAVPSTRVFRKKIKIKFLFGVLSLGV